MKRPYQQEDLQAMLDGLISYFGAHERRGEWHTDCPFCGKPAKHGQTHFSFWGEDGRHKAAGYKCHVCGEGGHIAKLYRMFCDDDKPVEAPVTIPQMPRYREPKTIAWRDRNADRILSFYVSDAAITAWQQYKPLRRETIERFALGLGPLPRWDERRGVWTVSSQARLVVPVFDRGGDHIVALRGRSITKSRIKWMTAKGSETTLYNAHLLDSAPNIWIVENNIDALLLMQSSQDIIAVSPTTGAATWRQEWSQWIADASPKIVRIAYDNDAAGCKNASELVAPSLRKVGLRPVLFDWSRFPDAPEKADIGWFFVAR